MEKKYFGKLNDGTDAWLYSFTNEKGMTMTVSDFGATLVSAIVPDRDGVLRDVVLGYDSPQEYVDRTCFFGATVGRSGNRIDQARFVINGTTYHLAPNDNAENNLHSGTYFYHCRKWMVKSVDEEKNSITFHLLSPDGDQGYPGNFNIDVSYTLTADNAVEIHYQGCSDADTVANLTNHTYFNLAGHDSGSIEGQILQLAAEAYTPVRDMKSIPTGEIAPVAGTPMDFTQAKPIGRDIGADFAQLSYTGGYDHNFVLSREAGTMKKGAEAYSEQTGIRMEMYTDCCGVQFYAGNFITEHPGKGGVTYDFRHGFCLESQYYPNSINEPGFASPLLKAGEVYDTTTSYRFIV